MRTSPVLPAEPPGRGRSGGFTLVEMLVVVALLAAVALLLAGRMELRSSDPLTRSVNRLERLIAAKRIEALRSGRPVLVRRPELEAELHPEVRLEASGLPFTFRPDGSASGGRLALAVRGKERALRLDWLTGRLLAEESANDG